MWKRKTQEDQLEKALKENRNKLKISRDGFVSIDLNSKEALKAIREQIDKIKDVTVEA